MPRRRKFYTEIENIREGMEIKKKRPYKGENPFSWGKLLMVLFIILLAGLLVIGLFLSVQRG